jgi:hypothetical protein
LNFSSGYDYRKALNLVYLPTGYILLAGEDFDQKLNFANVLPDSIVNNLAQELSIENNQRAQRLSNACWSNFRLQILYVFSALLEILLKHLTSVIAKIYFFNWIFTHDNSNPDFLNSDQGMNVIGKILQITPQNEIERMRQNIQNSAVRNISSYSYDCYLPLLNSFLHK